MCEVANLKMKFKLNQLEFEIEGNQETVKEQFESFKAFISNDLLPKINVGILPKDDDFKKDTPKRIGANFDILEGSTEEIPALKEVVLRDLPKSETDWILIYACYATSFKQETFTEGVIKTSYEQSGRSNKSRLSNLSNNIKSLLNKQFIKVHNDTEYLLKSDGITYAYQILKGNSLSKTVVKKASSQRGLKNSDSTATNSQVKKSLSSNSFKLDKQLNLRPEDKESLKDFAAKYQTDSTPKQIVVIVYYLKEILGVANINCNHIYTGLEELNIRIPESLDNIINNVKNRNGWLDFESKDDIGLSIQGRNAFKFDLTLRK